MTRVPANEVELWDATMGKELARIAGGYPAFSPDGRLLATAPWHGAAPGPKDAPGSFTLWESATAKKLCTVPVPTGHPYRLLFSPDGRMLATASSRNGTGSQQSVVYLWPLVKDESGVRVGPARVLAEGLSPRLDSGGPAYWFGDWVFSPEGRTLAVGGAGGVVRLLETASSQDRARFAGHGGDITALAFSPDGYRLASGSRDTTVLVWDVTGRLEGGHLRAASLSAADMEKLWAELVADDAGRAGRAVWALAADPARAVPYLRERLRTVAVDVTKALARVSQLVSDLDAAAFPVRQKAKAELARQGGAAEPATREALAKSPSPEVRHSLEQLLQALVTDRPIPSRETLRGVRGVEVLERTGTREAREALQAVAANAPAASALAHEARTALDRLGRAAN
jgi:hypothetical protein